MLIIEDETFIAMDLEGLVESLGHRVLGVARTHSEAVTLAKTKRPGLILADIQLADGSSGLDAVNELLRSFEVPVIFITAYPERFLTGERPEPAFLIAKPFQPATVSAVISQALFFERKARRPQRRARPDLFHRYNENARPAGGARCRLWLLRCGCLERDLAAPRQRIAQHHRFDDHRDLCELAWRWPVSCAPSGTVAAAAAGRWRVESAICSHSMVERITSTKNAGDDQLGIYRSDHRQQRQHRGPGR